MRPPFFLFFILSILFSPLAVASKTSPDFSKIPQNVKPIQVSGEEFGTLAYEKLLFDIKPGSKMGEAYQGVTKVKLADIYADPLFRPVQEKALRAQFNRILKATGYRVIGNDDLFDQKNAEEAEYLLGGKITAESYMRSVSVLGFKIEQSYTVEWQLFRVAEKKVVFTHVSSGAKAYRLKTGDEGLDVLGEALKSLLAEPEFSAALKK